MTSIPSLEEQFRMAAVPISSSSIVQRCMANEKCKSQIFCSVRIFFSSFRCVRFISKAKHKGAEAKEKSLAESCLHTHAHIYRRLPATLCSTRTCRKACVCLSSLEKSFRAFMPEASWKQLTSLSHLAKSIILTATRDQEGCLQKWLIATMTLEMVCSEERLSSSSLELSLRASVNGRQTLTKKREEKAGPAEKNVADMHCECDWQGALCCEKLRERYFTLSGSGEIAPAANYPAIKLQSIWRILLKEMSKARRNAPPPPQKWRRSPKWSNLYTYHHQRSLS